MDIIGTAQHTIDTILIFRFATFIKQFRLHMLFLSAQLVSGTQGRTKKISSCKVF